MKTLGFCPECLSQVRFDGQTYRINSHFYVHSFFVYEGPIGEAIKRVKRSGSIPAARFLAAIFNKQVHPFPNVHRTYIPAPYLRKRRRGLDLPQILAGSGAKSYLRHKDVNKQFGLSAQERLRTEPDKFALLGEKVPQQLVLVDDVRTTGTTLSLAAGLLNDAGCQVFGLSLACSGKPDRSYNPVLVGKKDIKALTK